MDGKTNCLPDLQVQQSSSAASRLCWHAGQHTDCSPGDRQRIGRRLWTDHLASWPFPSESHVNPIEARHMLSLEPLTCENCKMAVHQSSIAPLRSFGAVLEGPMSVLGVLIGPSEHAHGAKMHRGVGSAGRWAAEKQQSLPGRW